MGRGYQRGNLGVHRGKASGNSKPFPSLCSSIHQPGPPKRAGAAENWPHACLPDGRGGDEKRGQGISMVPQGAGELTLLIWSWVFLILWSSGVSATTLKPLPLFFSNSSL